MAGRATGVVLAALAFGALAFGSTFGVYVVLGGFDSGFSTDSVVWGAFGSYFGGVLGPVMSFGSVVILLLTIMQQHSQLKSLSEQRLKEEQRHHLESIATEIDRVLSRNVATVEGTQFPFRDLVYGYVLRFDNYASLQVRRLKSRLVSFTFAYCEAIALYRANIDTNFSYRVHWSRADEICQWILTHQDYLGDNDRLALQFARQHLNGQQPN